MPLVRPGIPEARRALLTDNGLADRFESVELPRWADNVAFRRPLASPDALLPLRRSSELEQGKVRAATPRPSEGTAARVVRLLERLTVKAIRSGAERTTLKAFDAFPARAPLLSMGHRRRSAGLTGGRRRAGARSAPEAGRCSGPHGESGEAVGGARAPTTSAAEGPRSLGAAPPRRRIQASAGAATGHGQLFWVGPGRSASLLPGLARFRSVPVGADPASL